MFAAEGRRTLKVEAVTPTAGAPAVWLPALRVALYTRRRVALSGTRDAPADENPKGEG